MDVNACFAERLVELRTNKGISQSKLADELGISRGSISFYENAQRTADIDTLYRVADYFDVSLDYLLGVSREKNTFLAVCSHNENMHEKISNLSPYSVIEIENIYVNLVECISKFEEYYAEKTHISNPGAGEELCIHIQNIIESYDAAITYLSQNLPFESLIYKFNECTRGADRSMYFIWSLARSLGVDYNHGNGSETK